MCGTPLLLLGSYGFRTLVGGSPIERSIVFGLRLAGVSTGSELPISGISMLSSISAALSRISKSTRTGRACRMKIAEVRAVAERHVANRSRRASTIPLAASVSFLVGGGT